MTWRGRTSIPDRLWSCVVYILPLIEVFVLGIFLMAKFPIIGLFYVPLFPVMYVYAFLGSQIPYFSFMVFLALYFFLVKNGKINHFIRFNIMQALMLSIVVQLFLTIMELLNLLYIPSMYSLLISGIPQGSSSSAFIWEIVLDAIFIGIVGSCLYSIVQALRGAYAEIPVISEAAYVHSRNCCD